jgi:hypothetical protein
MDEKKTVELLPKGQFVINRIVNDLVKPIKGRFSMYVLDRFCEERKIDNYYTLLSRIMAGMTIRDYADLILFAIDDYYRNVPEKSGYSRADIMDMIDDTMDGISSEHFDSLIKHAVGRVANVSKLKDAIDKLSAEAEEEKKRELSGNSTDTPSGSTATNQV